MKTAAVTRKSFDDSWLSADTLEQAGSKELCELFHGMSDSVMMEAMRGHSALEASLAQWNTVKKWKARQEDCSEEEALFRRLMEEPGVYHITVDHRQPELFLYVVCGELSQEMYFFVSGCLLDYEEQTGHSTVFVLLDEAQADLTLPGWRETE